MVIGGHGQFLGVKMRSEAQAIYLNNCIYCHSSCYELPSGKFWSENPAPGCLCRIEDANFCQYCEEQIEPGEEFEVFSMGSVKCYAHVECIEVYQQAAKSMEI